MRRKNRFYGKYYKFISDDGYTFAFIESHSNEGDMLQIITIEKGYYINDVNMIKIDGNIITFDVHQDDLDIVGVVTLGELHPLKKKVMGIFSYLPLECKHEIYSMYHHLDGRLSINGKDVIYSKDIARGYIEGDKGKNFPSKYVWYNSVTNDVSVTLAIATIPILKIFSFTGLLCFIRYQDKEYYICTYNRGKVKHLSSSRIEINRKKYRFILDIPYIAGHQLKAPIKGDMTRYIKENIVVPTSYIFYENDNIIFKKEDGLSSLEYMY